MIKGNKPKIEEYLKKIEVKLGDIESRMATKVDLETLHVQTKDDLNKGLSKLEKGLIKRFDKMDLTLDQDLSEVKQHVAHIEDNLPNLPPFHPVAIS